MAKLESLGKVIETDVLVIGGGVAGLWAANRAAEMVKRVTIVDKGPKDWGGLGSFAGGDVLSVMPGENVDDFVEEMVYYHDGLCEQDHTRQIFEQILDRVKDYQRLGCQFLTEPDGSLKGFPQRGLKHVKAYTAKVTGPGGKYMVQALLKETDRLGVERIGRTLVTDLVKEDGAIAGAVGFNTLSGDFIIFKAKAVVITTGHPGWKGSYSHNTATGEGTMMALRAGADLANFEFVRVWNVPKLFAWEGQTKLLPLGAKFVNARGEVFMSKYSPVLGTNTDNHYTTRAMAFEDRAGNTPIYLDCSPLSPEIVELMTPEGGWAKLNYDKLLKLGIDFFKSRVEWMPQLLTSCGGVRTDTRGNTTVPGLFAAGLAQADAGPGPSVGCWELSTATVTGWNTGANAGKYAVSHEMSEMDVKEVSELKRRLFAPLGKAGIAPKEVLMEVLKTICPAEVCILKSGPNLKKAIDRLGSIKDELVPQMVASEPHYLMKLIETRAITRAGELFLRTSLMREESRSGHYREDFPDRDDRNWLKWIVISEKDGKLNLRTEPLAFDRYKFKPTRYYMDNFTFPRVK